MVSASSSAESLDAEAVEGSAEDLLSSTSWGRGGGRGAGGGAAAAEVAGFCFPALLLDLSA